MGTKCKGAVVERCGYSRAGAVSGRIVYPLRTEDSGVKHLLTGLVIAAAMAVAAPALAQAPTKMGGHHATAGAAKAKPMTKKRAVRHHRPGAMHRMRAGDDNSAANDLNRQELQRLQMGSAPAGMAPAPGAAASGQIGPAPGGGQNIRPGPAGGPVSMAPGAAEMGARASGGGNIPAPTGPVPVTAPPPIAQPPR